VSGGSRVTTSQEAVGAFPDEMDGNVAAGWRTTLDDLRRLVEEPAAT
jgi:hypothetical protein